MTGNLQLITEYASHLQVERNLSEHTVAAYSGDLMQFAEILDERHVLLITAGHADVQAFVHHLAKNGREPVTRARKITSLRRFYRWLILAELLEVDPTARILPPKLGKSLPKPIERDVMQGILDRVEAAAAMDSANPYALRNHAMIEMFYGSAARVSELCSLQQDDIRFATSQALLAGKGKKQRLVPIGKAACVAIRTYLKHARPQLARHARKADATQPKGTQAMFLSARGKGISRRSIHTIVSKTAGPEEHIYPHRFRHTAATDMLDAGANLRQVQEQLGHASIATTQRYTGVSTGQLQDAHAKFHPRGRAQG